MNKLFILLFSCVILYSCNQEKLDAVELYEDVIEMAKKNKSNQFTYYGKDSNEKITFESRTKFAVSDEPLDINLNRIVKFHELDKCQIVSQHR